MMNGYRNRGNLLRAERVIHHPRFVAAVLALACVAVVTSAQSRVAEQAVSDAATMSVREEPKPLLRGERYCELMIVRKIGRKYEAEIWSTQGVSRCPEDCEAAWDTGDIKSEMGARRVVVNGPKIWLPSSPAPTPPEDSRRRFGDIELGLVATLEVNRSSRDPYKERAVARETSNTFKRGDQVYELTSRDGAVYVMQSMSLSEDPDLTIDQLPTLESRLRLPRGWSYRARVLEEDLVLAPRDGEVVVLQDRLKNTYQRR